MNYDKMVEAFSDEWNSYADECERGDLVLSLTRHLIPTIYNKIRNNDLAQEQYSPRRNGGYTVLRYMVNHIYWILLWTIKWGLFQKRRNKKNILVAVGSDRKMTKQYLNCILDYAVKNDLVIISLNVPCFKEILFNKNIFYFNRFLSFTSWWNYTKKRKDYYEKVYDKALKIVASKFSFELNNKTELRKIFRRYNYDSIAFMKLLRKIKPQNIKFLLTDFDYTTNKVIYTKVCKGNKIPTICVDHSIQFYNHLFKKNFSDLRLVWGEYSKQRIISNSDNNLPKINIVGKPGNFLFKNNKKRGSDWLYILSPYSEPAYQTIYRSLALSREYYLAIMSVLEKRGINKKLYIKSHPEDGNIIAEYFTLPGKNNYRFINKSIFKYLENFELIFIEDTTLILDLALYNIPIIYLADRSKKDIFNISKTNSIGFAESVETLEKEIEVQVGNSINENDRLNFINYFINTSKKFETELHDSINNFLEYR